MYYMTISILANKGELNRNFIFFAWYIISILYVCFSAKVAEEKIRYATYNCVDIDTDMNVYED